MFEASGKPARRPLAILVHGMGRTPVSMALLAHRLRRQGFGTAIFGYAVTLEKFSSCLTRLQEFITARTDAGPYVLIGHSLGAVLLRCVAPRLAHLPAACFLLAPPAKACIWARRFASFAPYRIAMGEMGQLLADESFMSTVPIPPCPTWIYAGTAGPRHPLFALADEPNDGILKISETQVPGIPLVRVPALHTFFMNSRWVTRDLVDKTRAVLDPPAPGALAPLATPVPGE